MNFPHRYTCRNFGAIIVCPNWLPRHDAAMPLVEERRDPNCDIYTIAPLRNMTSQLFLGRSRPALPPCKMPTL